LWLAAVAQEHEGWVPVRFEFGFGLPDLKDLDPRSSSAPARLSTGALLRGSVDLVERRAGQRELRVTDHKTGKDRTNRELIVQGGTVLQPVLYALALEAITSDPVVEGRLFFCTSAGDLTTRSVEMNALARQHAQEVLTIVDHAIAEGHLHPAPAPQQCDWCDFRQVCGPYEERRVTRKDNRTLRHLEHLRSLQ
jgi:CRISPR/Cas system-associated exonuclease Cas4 (RecB family)